MNKFLLITVNNNFLEPRTDAPPKMCSLHAEHCLLGAFLKDFFQNSFDIENQSPRGVLPEDSVLRVGCKFSGAHPCLVAISIKLQSSFVEIALLHGCFPRGCFVFVGHLSGEHFRRTASELR